MNTPHWKIEVCNQVGIFNGSYMITEPDLNWPDDPDERKVVCRLPTGFNGHYLENAQLIAASPELLAACQQVLAILPDLKNHGQYQTDAACATLVEAIAKATGQQIPTPERAASWQDENERAAAIARLNARQQTRNLFTNIGEREVKREIKRHVGR